MCAWVIYVKAIFVQLEHSEDATLPPDSMRAALALAHTVRQTALCDSDRTHTSFRCAR